MVPPEIPSKKWAWLFHQGSGLSALAVRPVRKLKIKTLKPESWQPPKPVYDKRMLITPPTSSASYQKVSDMLGYPYCGIVSMALASVAAETGFASVFVRGVYRADNEGSKEQPHTWVRLKTRYGVVSVDLTHRQFGGLESIVSIYSEEEAKYGFYPRFVMPIGPGDFEAMLELATRGGNWERFLPLKEYSAEFVAQLILELRELHTQVMLREIKSAMSFYGKRVVVCVDGIVDGDMFINDGKGRNVRAIFSRTYQREGAPYSPHYRQRTVEQYREPVASHFVKNKSPGWLRS